MAEEKRAPAAETADREIVITRVVDARMANGYAFVVPEEERLKTNR